MSLACQTKLSTKQIPEVLPTYEAKTLHAAVHKIPKIKSEVEKENVTSQNISGKG